jgi:hypothetical protein
VDTTRKVARSGGRKEGHEAKEAVLSLQAVGLSEPWACKQGVAGGPFRARGVW